MGSQKLAVSRNCLPCGVGEPMAMATSPRLPIGRVQCRDVSATNAYKPQPVASKPTGRPSNVNELIADLQLGSIPLDARRSGDLVPPPPTPPPLFRGGKIAIALQGADFDAARLLDCSPSCSPVPGQNRNPLQILGLPLGGKSMIARPITGRHLVRNEFYIRSYVWK